MENEVGVLKVGSVLPAMAGRGEGVYFDLSDSGYLLIYNYAGPDEKELAAMREGQAFEIRFTVLEGVIWVLSKCGSMEWTDAPFHPMLSRYRSVPLPSEANAGALLTLIMTDAPSGEVKTLRAIGLGHRFSVALAAAIAERMTQPFDGGAYDASVRSVQARYSTRELVARAADYFRLR